MATLALFTKVNKPTPRQADLVARLPDFTAQLPPGVAFTDPTWNVAAWSKRPVKALNLNFERIGNPDMTDLCKIFLLEYRHLRKVAANACQMSLTAFEALGQAMQARSWDTITRGDFMQAEKLLIGKYNHNTAYRYSSELGRIAAWLKVVLEKPLSHTPSGTIRRTHGRGSPTAGDEAKLLPNEVLADFLAARHRPGVSARDAFFLHALALQVACGFRAHEMATLPVDCLIDDAGSLLVRNFSSKGGRSAPRPISPLLAPMVRESVAYLTQATQQGRAAARRLQQEAIMDWPAIAQDADATAYFVGRIAHAWTANPDNRLINPNGSVVRGKVVDVLAVMEETGSMVQAGIRLGVDRSTIKRLIEEQTYAREGKLEPRRAQRTSWDTDIRAFSMIALIATVGNTVLAKSPHLPAIQAIVADTLAHQLRSEVFPEPPYDLAKEQAFRKRVPPVLRDGDGNAILEAWDALMVLEGHALSDTKATKETSVHYVGTADLNRWLSGELRGRGTKGPEDAAAARLGILHPDTQEPASFTWHDVRHWLNTTYEAGGMTQEQIAMLFNRKNTKQNSVYSHIPQKHRTDGIKSLIERGAVTGPLASAVGKIAEHSREDAEKYLAAMTRTHTPMPHGLCTLNWALETCPHHLSCFSCNTDTSGKGVACEHLVVDTTDVAHTTEITRLRDTSRALVAALEERELENSPAFAHHKRIIESTTDILGDETP
jgi:hypothetical protein